MRGRYMKSSLKFRVGTRRNAVCSIGTTRVPRTTRARLQACKEDTVCMTTIHHVNFNALRCCLCSASRLQSNATRYVNVAVVGTFEGHRR